VRSHANAVALVIECSIPVVFDRLYFSSPLDIKLRTDALGRSILFIGYSLSDVNSDSCYTSCTNFGMHRLMPMLGRPINRARTAFLDGPVMVCTVPRFNWR